MVLTCSHNNLVVILAHIFAIPYLCILLALKRSYVLTCLAVSIQLEKAIRLGLQFTQSQLIKAYLPFRIFLPFLQSSFLSLSFLSFSLFSLSFSLLCSKLIRIVKSAWNNTWGRLQSSIHLQLHKKRHSERGTLLKSQSHACLRSNEHPEECYHQSLLDYNLLSNDLCHSPQE